VYKTQNYWVWGLFPSSRRKLDLFPFSDEVEKTPTLLDPLERANLNHWTSQVRHSLPLAQQGFTNPENPTTGEFSQIICQVQ
jgi:hypothetical protein